MGRKVTYDLDKGISDVAGYYVSELPLQLAKRSTS